MNVRLAATAVVAAAVFAGGASGASHPTTATTSIPGLVAAYAFDESTGQTAADASGHENTAKLSNASFAPAGGKYAGAVVLDGVSSLVSVPDSAGLDLSSRMTVEAWVRPTSSLSGSRTVIAKERVGAGFPYGIETNGGLPGGYATAGSTFVRADGKTALPLNTWRFVAATYGGTTVRVYVNGKQVASQAATGAIATSERPLRIGGDAVWGEYFAGRIDNVRIYSTALTATQIQTDMSTAVSSPAVAKGDVDTQAPSTPTGLSASGVTTSAITLAWAASTDNVGVTGYRVYQDGAEVGTVTATSDTFTGLSCWSVPGNGIYALGVAAFDAAGNQSPIASLSRQTLQCPPVADTEAPSSPAGLIASGATQTAITLSWTASTDNVAVAGYRAYLNGTQAGSSSATTYGFSNLACGTTYGLGVQAYDAVGNSSVQSSMSATTAACSTTTPPPPPPVAGSANVWLDKNGGSCTRQASAGAWVDAQACGNFKAALAAAQPGDTVLVVCSGGTTSCTYAPETLSGDRGASARVTVAAAPGFTVSFEETAGSHVYVWLNNLHHVTFQNIGFGQNNAGESTPNLRVDCTRDVTLVNASGRRFYLFEGNANLTFQGGSWGGYSGVSEEDSTMGTTGAYGPASTCPGDSGPRPPSNILFDGVTWHDVFWISSCSVVNGGQCSQWGGAHPDCFEINGYVDGVTIQNSTFYHCGNTMLSLYTDQGDIKNVIVKNNTFRDMAPSSYYGVQWVDTANFKCDGDKFINNTYTPNAPSGWFANTPPRFACQTTSNSTGVVVSGNTIQQAPPSTECTSSKGSPNYTVWQNNTFQSGSC